MKKWIFIAVIVCVAFTVINAIAKSKQAHADPQPTPLIKFEGSKVIFSDELSDCH